MLVKLGAGLERTRREVYAMQEGENPPSPNSSGRVEMRRCVLCGKPKEQVPKLILGLHGGICVACVALCNDVIQAADE